MEYFLAAAINIGPVFEDLAQRIIEAQGQPGVIYDLHHKAQLLSKLNRKGGRVNQRIIEMLVPTVTAQLVYDPDCRLSPQQVLEKIPYVLQNTSPDDVKWLAASKKLGFEMSGYYERAAKESTLGATTVLEYYTLRRKESRASGIPSSDEYHFTEMLNGLPTAAHMVNLMREYQGGETGPALREAIEYAYSIFTDTMPEDFPRGQLADSVVVAIYLLFSHFPDYKIVC